MERSGGSLPGPGSVRDPAGGPGTGSPFQAEGVSQEDRSKDLGEKGGKERVQGAEAEERRLSQRKVADSVCDQSCLTKRPLTQGLVPSRTLPFCHPKPIRRRRR